MEKVFQEVLKDKQAKVEITYFAYQHHKDSKGPAKEFVQKYADLLGVPVTEHGSNNNYWYKAKTDHISVTSFYEEEAHEQVG